MVLEQLASVSKRCARYPYEVIVFCTVISTGVWSLPRNANVMFNQEIDSTTDEFRAMVIVGRCLALLHIFYQIKKLKLFTSAWLLAGVAICGVCVFAMLSVASHIVIRDSVGGGEGDWLSILPVLLLVTEMDFIHALLVTASRSASRPESVPDTVSSTVYRLGPRLLATSSLDIACLLCIMLYAQDSAIIFAMKISIYAIMSNAIQFFTIIPAVVTVTIYWMPPASLRQITEDKETGLLVTRALQNFKFGSGFEVFALLTTTFIFVQSKVFIGLLLRRFCPLPVVLLAREYVGPYWPGQFSFAKTGVVTFLLVSIFRYLILDNVRKSRVSSAPSPVKSRKTDSSSRGRFPSNSVLLKEELPTDQVRSLDVLKSLLKEQKCDLMSNGEILKLVSEGMIRPYALEKVLDDPARGVLIRRRLTDSSIVANIPFTDYDFGVASKACCENIVGYVPIPVGVVGPLTVDGDSVSPILATTEGALVASVNRGCKVLREAGGTRTSIFRNEMSRAPCVSFDSAADALQCFKWIQCDYNFMLIKEAFESTTRFGKLQKVSVHPAGRLLFIRFVAETGDAMGMNMVSKGCEKALGVIVGEFPSAKVEAISGNACTDKKPSAMNWINGRGKTITAECEIDDELLRLHFKCSAAALAELNVKKNLIGSCVAGSVGGFNAHAANIVAACFIASGQDAAQVVEGSQTMTLLEERERHGKVVLHASVTMMSLEVAAIGGGTNLEPQKSILQKMIGSCGSSPGEKANKLASVIASTVLAGELSLMSSLVKGDLVKSHLKLNRISSKPPPNLYEKEHKML